MVNADSGEEDGLDDFLGVVGIRYHDDTGAVEKCVDDADAEQVEWYVGPGAGGGSTEEACEGVGDSYVCC